MSFLEVDYFHQGLAEDLITRIEPSSVALSVWSPPYRVGKQYERGRHSRLGKKCSNWLSEAIIDSEIWDHVQAEIERRGRSYANPNHVFAACIHCGQCGGTFGRKKWHSGTKYERFIWRCNSKYEGKRTRCCTTPHVTEDKVKRAFVEALAQ